GCARSAAAARPASGLALVGPRACSGPGATFHDANTPTSSLADFTATIDWGDGTAATSGSVTAGGGSYTVDGGHTYRHLGSFTIQVHIDDDGGSTADATTTMLVYAVPADGSFVIGDGGQAVGHDVTFWGAQWWKGNDLSAGKAPAAFKGFAGTPATVTCGTSWSADPGNSMPPPPGQLPPYMAVLVSSAIRKSGSTISGNTVHVVVVKTNPGYAANPGQAG